MMLAVEFADFGFGTVVGAVVAGSIAIFLDQRRRKDEKKRLFLEEKRLMYRGVSQAFDNLANAMVFLAGVGPYLERLEELEEESEPEALKQVELAVDFSSKLVTKTEEQLMDAFGDFPLLGSRASGVPYMKVRDIINRMHEALKSGEYEKVIELRKEYDSAVRRFRSSIRQDLGIDA